LQREPTEKEEVPQVKILDDKKSRNLGMCRATSPFSLVPC
jgi:hypothetical protein